MRRERNGACTRRERLEVTAVALTPAALGLLAQTVMLAGRLSWLAPILALPVGLCLSRVWDRLGKKDLGGGLKEAFGKTGGSFMGAVYFLWALILLTDAARRYSERLLTISEGEGARWLFLLLAFCICLWLGRKGGTAFARTGRIFFLAVGAALTGVLLLALPGVDWKNLWPPERADWRELPGGAILCLSIAGYGVYALCLPRGEKGDIKRAFPWVVLGCGAFAALLFILVGTFGPVLAGRLDDPFLYLLEGVGVPGAFRRGEAGLIAVLTLADLVLLTLLTRGCGTIWRDLVPVFPGLGWAVTAVSFILAGVLPGMGRAWGRLAAAIPAGNLVLGVLLPTFAVLTIQARERKKGQATFCGMRFGKKADVAVKQAQKKSGKENEKKC